MESVEHNAFMRGPLRVLIIEDSENDTLLMAAELRRGGLEPVFERVETAASLHAALDVHSWDLIICDYSMPQLAGPEALAQCQRETRPRWHKCSPRPQARFGRAV